MESLAEEFKRIGAVNFGDFVLKSGERSRIYYDLRIIISHPRLMKIVGDIIWNQISETNLKFDFICGVPYTALPIATYISCQYETPMVLKRKEEKQHGTKKMIEGEFQQGSNVVIIEDVVTTGSSVIETANALRSVGLVVTHVVVILDRCQGAKDNLLAQGITMIPLLNPSHFSQDLSIALDVNYKVVEEAFKRKILTLSCEKSKKLLENVMNKKSNLILSVDFTDSLEIMGICALLKDHICGVKTHIDGINFTSLDEIEKFKHALNMLNQYGITIIEDRKFADIGATVEKQLKSSPYNINSYADLVTVHGIPGKGILQAFENSNVSLLLLAQMSSDGTLTDQSYKEKIFEMGKEFNNVAGFITQSQVPKGYLGFTPGVSLDKKGDALGQKYVSVDEAILTRGADLIIVGRGITGVDPSLVLKTAIMYKEKGWNAFCKKLIHQ